MKNTPAKITALFCIIFLTFTIYRCESSVGKSKLDILEAPKSQYTPIIKNFVSDHSLYSDQFEIIIVGSSDMHGKIFPYNPITGNTDNYSLAHISSWLKLLRASGKEVFYLDNGDFFNDSESAKSPIRYFNRRPGPHVAIKMLNYMKLVAMCVGNHEIFVGKTTTDRLKREMTTAPLLSGNIFQGTTTTPYFQPYTNIITKKGLKISVLGMTTSEVQMLENGFQGTMKCVDVIPSLKTWLSHIKTNENPDLTIGLIHAGLGSNTPPNESLHRHLDICYYIAANIPGFDFIFKGHDHESTLVDVPSINNKSIVVLGGEAYTKSIAQVTLKIGKRNKKWVVMTSTYEIIDFNMVKIEPDKEFMKVFNTEYLEYKKTV